MVFHSKDEVPGEGHPAGRTKIVRDRRGKRSGICKHRKEYTTKTRLDAIATAQYPIFLVCLQVLPAMPVSHFWFKRVRWDNRAL